MKRHQPHGTIAVLFALLTVLYLHNGLTAFDAGDVLTARLFFLLSTAVGIVAIGCSLRRNAFYILAIAASILGFVGVLVSFVNLFFKAWLPLQFLLIMIALIAYAVLYVNLFPLTRR